MPKAILIFGAAKLQRSLINLANKAGLFTIAIDPDPKAECSMLVDVFEVIEGNDYEGTLAIAKKHNISGLITAATDKPLVMMAHIAESLKIPFYSVETAVISTDKHLMKSAFLKGNIPCAKGILAANIEDIIDFEFPIIVKPRDNSGSRGVVYCENRQELKNAFKEAMEFTKKETVLIEEYIEGKEYSIESLHYGGETIVVQYTEKITSALPYNVEIGHNQPAGLTDAEKNAIKLIIEKIAKTLGFINCASHTELKINSQGIFVIETSPRLGGDFITSHLVPLSTGVNIEEALIEIALGGNPELPKSLNKASLIRYLNFTSGKISHLNLPSHPNDEWKSEHFSINLTIGDTIPLIKNSLNRYGEIIFSGDTIFSAIKKQEDFSFDMLSRIKVEN